MCEAENRGEINLTGLICCTLNCNLACKYCYEGNGLICKQPDIEKINRQFCQGKDKIIKFIDELYKYNGEVKTTIIWHGGEPTLIKPRFLTEIMEDQRQKRHEIIWSMQSNGTIMTDEFLKMCSNYNVKIGVSVDGLKKHHDKYRVFKNGNPTFDIIMSNINKCKKKGIACGTLVTITDNNVNDLKSIYDFFAEKKINFNFNALFPTSLDVKATLSEKDYTTAICELFDTWIKDEETFIMLTPFEQIIEGLLDRQRGVPACHWSRDCSKSFTAIDTQGNLYPCEHWVGNPEMCFGNISDGLENALKKTITFQNEKTD